MKSIFTSLFFFLLLTNAYTQPGTLDPTVGVGGKINTDFGFSSDEARALIVQPDGKIISAGSSQPNTYSRVALVRNNPDGSPDLTFGTSGKVITDLGKRAFINTIALQSDGKIIVAGLINSDINFTDLLVIRYLTNGNPDNSFDEDGKVVLTIRNFTQATAISIQSDGKIVLAGQSTNGQTMEFTLTRLNPNGSLDVNFNGTGHVITHIGASNHSSYANALAIQSDGKIVVAGSSGAGNVQQKVSVARYNSNGSLDATFNGNGLVTDNIGLDDQANAVAIQNDGRIVLAGKTFNGSNYDYLVMRLNSNGSADLTYDGDGKVTTPIGTSDEVAMGIVLQSDGKAVVAGHSDNYDRNTGTTSRMLFSVVRYNTDGSRDANFGNNGIATAAYNTGISNGRGSSVAVYMNRIYVAGYVYLPGSSTGQDFALLAFQKDAVPLPLTLLNFSAAPANASVSCRWSTTQESNVAHHQIQRSTDGIHFETAGQLNAQNTSAASYNYTDDLSGMSQQVKTIYYRLQATDKDGKSTYSSIIRVDLKTRALFTVYPNPAYHFISIKGADLKHAKLYDQTGKQVLVKTLTGNQTSTINVYQLPRGLYTIVITNQTGDEQTKTIVLQ